MVSWVEEHQSLFWWLSGGSVVASLVTLIAVIVVIIRLPNDYFITPQKQSLVTDRVHYSIQQLWLIARSVLGLALILMGLILLVLPGQGVLTILIGITLLKFPGKHRIESWLVSRKTVQRPINWLRRRAGRAPLIFRT